MSRMENWMKAVSAIYITATVCRWEAAGQGDGLWRGMWRCGCAGGKMQLGGSAGRQAGCARRQRRQAAQAAQAGGENGHLRIGEHIWVNLRVQAGVPPCSRPIRRRTM